MQMYVGILEDITPRGEYNFCSVYMRDSLFFETLLWLETVVNTDEVVKSFVSVGYIGSTEMAHLLRLSPERLRFHLNRSFHLEPTTINVLSIIGYSSYRFIFWSRTEQRWLATYTVLERSRMAEFRGGVA